MPNPPAYLLAAIGVASGILSGLFGIGGGVVIVPALIYLAGFNQHLATGTSLAILLPPVGITAAFEYHRHGNVNIRAALIVAVSLLASGWIGAALANRVAGPYLRLVFGVFVSALGVSLIYGAMQRLGWI
jgi:uncharacterized membrane protein YfcA